MIFSEREMKDRLPSPVYKSWKKTVADEATLDRQTADAIAHAMKRWALEKGATHYTHWFQPMTGVTAEKHESFIDKDDRGEPLTHFSGRTLIKGEPDASSFPSGGLRATFEARGYTYWDVTSPAFIRDNVLCIPTVFVSYNGESLDKKDPLLRSIKAVSTAATRTVNLLGEKDVRSCTPMSGLEQEYFLVDQEHFNKRDDLRFCGRTLFGAPAPKGQELSDHYFGALPDRVSGFMKDVNRELWKLGIYSKTEHNEVAPGQFELAVLYNNANVTVDQNQLVMETLKKTASKHGLACLLHEKPFAGINGSGKHDNYSIVTDTGLNLFAPGDKPAENIRFLVFVCAFIKAVDTYPELLRMSAASVGNDHRLGASEAPPAIISIYLGSYIEEILRGLHKPEKTETKTEKPEFNPIAGLSYIPHDNTDRNRTSPVAFTGNKFEFRMVGSSMSGAFPNTVLNTIMAQSLNEISDQLEGIKYLQDVRSKALEICADIIHDHSKILFSGDGYSEAWVEEAKRRGLPNITSYVEAIEYINSPVAVDLFEKHGVYTKVELDARKEIYREQYRNTIGIEVKTMIEMSEQIILPAAAKEYAFYAALPETSAYIRKHTAKLSGDMDAICTLTDKLRSDYARIYSEPCSYENGQKIRDVLCADLKDLRSAMDEYERTASEERYPLPRYKDMLFAL
ncbi:MAG: glutamine synthetase III [Solobacterium sp.]|nr:glutamine synthetase III [Solobacterium sp.]